MKPRTSCGCAKTVCFKSQDRSDIAPTASDLALSAFPSSFFISIFLYERCQIFTPGFAGNVEAKKAVYQQALHCQLLSKVVSVIMNLFFNTH